MPADVNPQRGNCWPTREKTLLLRAALWRDKSALDAWREWKTGTDKQAHEGSDLRSREDLEGLAGSDSHTLLEIGLDVASTQLLPLLFVNLRARGASGAPLEKYKEIYLTTWRENQSQLNHAAPVLQALEQAGIPTMALKGAVLLSRYYADFGARPMGDIDLLVPTAQWSAAEAVLVRLGWQRRGTVPVYNARPFVHADGREIDLHWHLMHECLDAHADDDFWRASVSATLADVPTRILNPTDELLNVIVHGVRWNVIPTIRWIADAVTVLETSADMIDWERLLAQAAKRRVVLVLQKAFAFLRDEMNTPIPALVVERLNELPVARIEQMDYETKIVEAQTFGLKLYWVGYARLAPSRELRPFGILEYLRRVWALEHVWQVPLFAARRALSHRPLPRKSF
jgi:hypothetical protein